METFETTSPAATRALGRRLAGRLGRGDCVALTGELGAGKTALVRGLAEGLGVADRRMVSSPTFVLVQEYPGRERVYHVDLYRTVEAAAELADLGLDEMLADGVVLIEWADRAASALPADRWHIDIEMTGRTSRRFRVRKTQPSSAPGSLK